MRDWCVALARSRASSLIQLPPLLLSTAARGRRGSPYAYFEPDFLHDAAATKSCASACDTANLAGLAAPLQAAGYFGPGRFPPRQARDHVDLHQGVNFPSRLVRCLDIEPRNRVGGPSLSTPMPMRLATTPAFSRQAVLGEGGSWCCEGRLLSRCRSSAAVDGPDYPGSHCGPLVRRDEPDVCHRPHRR